MCIEPDRIDMKQQDLVLNLHKQRKGKSDLSVFLEDPAANVNDVAQAGALVHGDGTDVFASRRLVSGRKRKTSLPTGMWPCVLASVVPKVTTFR